MESIKKAIETLRHILVVSIGFMTDAYDLFVMGIVIVIISTIYPENGTSIAKSAMGSSVIVGIIIGQIIFGILSDQMGRFKIFIITIMIIIIFAIMSAFSFEIFGVGIWLSLSFFRFLLGIGIGGEYPVSASISAETSGAKTRGCRMATTFSTQGIGNLFAPLIVLLLLSRNLELNYVWRMALGFGALPPLCILFSRWRYYKSSIQIPNNDSDTKKIIKRPWDKENLELLRKNGLTLLGTGGSWFLMNITFYGNALFKETVIKLLNLDNGDTNYQIAINVTISSLIIAVIALPGYWLSIALVDRIGRRNIQIIGFFMMSILFVVMGILFDVLIQKPILFIIMYGLTFFFCNFGPNTITYIVSAEAFPKQIRSTCHGISAASGKIGAIIGVSIFVPFVRTFGINHTFIACSLVALLGAILTICLVPETMNLEWEDEVECNKSDLENAENMVNIN